MIKIWVDRKPYRVGGGKSLLQACLDQGIYIPHLCYMEGMGDPPASCRMCFVEIDGEEEPVTSCTLGVRDGLVVRTDTARVRGLQRSALRLLLSVHHVDCAHCPAHKKCELQRLASFLKVGLRPRDLPQFLTKPGIIEEHPVLNYYPNRCVLCGRCVFVGERAEGGPVLAFVKRGFETLIGSNGALDPQEVPEGAYAACVEACPVGALTLKETDPPSDGSR